MKNEFFWLAAAVAVATACSQSTAQQITTLPIELTNSKYPIPTVNVEVDGHRANLVLDTGAAGFSLTQAFQTSARLEMSDRELPVTYPDGSEKTLSVSVPLTLSTGGESIWSDALAVIGHTPMSDSLGLDGHFNPRWLSRDGCVEIDLKDRELRFASKTKFDSCPFEISSEMIEVLGDGLLPSKSVGAEFRIFLDTGSGISAAMEHLLDDEAAIVGNARIHWVWGIEEVELKGPFVLETSGPSFFMDAVSVHHEPLPETADVFIGFDALRHSRVVIDQGNFYWLFR